jgi:uncharacterized membrane protein
LTHSIWVLPSLGIVAALIAMRFTNYVDVMMAAESNIDPEVMRTLLGTLAASMFTVIVFVCSALLIAIQLASAQLTPRIIAFVFRDAAIKFALTLFVFIFTFSLALLIRIRGMVPLVSSYVAAYGFIFSLVVFLYLVDHLGKMLRPSGALRIVGSLGRRVIEEVYSRGFDRSPQMAPGHETITHHQACRTILNPRDGAILAFDVDGLRELAESADCVLELVPQVGDYVAIGDPLFRVYGGKTELTRDTLSQSVAVGQERTLQQDPRLAFRIMVDVASKALSPAINDPTTAVLALDQIHHMLRDVGGRSLDDERVRDKSGRLRLVYRTPDWADFVHLAVTEIRQFGGQSIQVARRLRAMLENLIGSLPPERLPLLHQELQLLSRSVKRCFPEPEDQALADLGDLQGVGGAREDQNTR